jgi:hypothetical protein
MTEKEADGVPLVVWDESHSIKGQPVLDGEILPPKQSWSNGDYAQAEDRIHRRSTEIDELLGVAGFVLPPNLNITIRCGPDLDRLGRLEKEGSSLEGIQWEQKFAAERRQRLLISNQVKELRKQSAAKETAKLEKRKAARKARQTTRRRK